MRCLFTAFFLCGIAIQVAAANENVAKSIGAQASEKGITVSLALPETVYAGVEIPLTVSVKNQGKNDVAYYEVWKYWDCHIEMFDSKGNAVPLTRFGKTAVGEGKPVARRIDRVIQPGKGFKETLNLACVFDLTMSGDYTVSITRIFNEETPGAIVKVTISKFPFRVLEPSLLPALTPSATSAGEQSPPPSAKLPLPATSTGEAPLRTPAKSVRIVTPNPSQPDNEERITRLRADPQLQAKLTENLKQPQLEELLQFLHRKTGLSLTVQVENLYSDQTIFGSLSLHNVPVWKLMSKLERTLLVDGRWEKVAGGYQLKGTLQPRFVGQPRATKAIQATQAVRGKKNLLRRTLASLSVVLLLLVAIYLRWRWRDRQGNRATTGGL